MKLSKLFRGFGKNKADTKYFDEQINLLIKKIEGVEKILNRRNLLEEMWWDSACARHKLEVKVKKLEKELENKEV